MQTQLFIVEIERCQCFPLTHHIHLYSTCASVSSRWNSCKQNKQAANNRAATANQTPSPEGEKLHSDSGISVDSQSLQEQQAQTQTQTQNQTQIGKITGYRHRQDYCHFCSTV